MRFRWRKKRKCRETRMSEGASDHAIGRWSLFDALLALGLFTPHRQRKWLGMLSVGVQVASGLLDRPAIRRRHVWSRCVQRCELLLVRTSCVLTPSKRGSQ